MEGLGNATPYQYNYLRAAAAWIWIAEYFPTRLVKGQV